MKRLIYLSLFFVISCGSGKSKNENKNEQSKVVPSNQPPVEYKWYKKTSDYYKKKIEVYGFVWLDTITEELPPGGYSIFERPNCYDCGELTVSSEIPLKILQIKDSTIENTNKGSQWRLVKVTTFIDKAEYNTIEQIEMAEYSYPDYQNSGFTPILNADFEGEYKYEERKYVEGYLDLALLTISDDKQMLRLKNNGLKRNISAFINVGSLPNQVERLPERYSAKDLKVRDKYGNLVNNKKVRLYGIWNGPNIEDTKDSGGIFYVEVIELIE